MKKNLIILIILIANSSILSCQVSTKMDQKYIDALEKFIRANSILLENYTFVISKLKKSNYQYSEQSICRIDEYGVNQLVSISKDYSVLKDLWEEKLVEYKHTAIEIYQDSIVTYWCKTYHGNSLIAPLKFHYLMYSPSSSKGISNPLEVQERIKVLTANKISDNWYYVIVEFYPD